MGRPKKCRWVETEPGVTFFKPRGIPLRALQQIVITVDELEAMRLADFLEMTQEEVAQQMQVSRPTVTRMLSRAHRAVAEALVHGKAICIQGGDYRVGQIAITAGNGPARDRGTPPQNVAPANGPKTRRSRRPRKSNAAFFLHTYQRMARAPLRGRLGGWPTAAPIRMPASISTRADVFIKGIRDLVKSTYRTGVLGEIGSFGGMFHLGADRYRDPVLVSSTDGVGTKIKIAVLMNRHDTIGIDLVAMCANDIIVHGATPLFFLDYLAVGELSPETATLIIDGITQGCKQARCSLIGGETAEMPGIYQPGDYDLAGFVVGVVERDQIIDGSTIGVGHRIIGLASSGLHSNGYSLVRQVLLERHRLRLEDEIPELGGPLGEELLKPTRIYVETVLNLLRDFPLSGIGHITGGGLTDNVPRILPKSCQAVIQRQSWPVPPIFQLLQDKGNIPEAEMLRTFNNGIGLVVVVAEEYVADVLLRLQGLNEQGYVIGEIVERKNDDPPLVYV